MPESEQVMAQESQADFYECGFCEAKVKEEDVFWGEDGSTAFCSTDCRNQFEEDAAVSRMEARSDWR